jgi:hypothetical protein
MLPEPESFLCLDEMSGDPERWAAAAGNNPLL